MDLMMRWASMEQWNWIMFGLSIPVQLWFGGRLLRLGAEGLFSSSLEMNSLILLGTMAAFIFSAVVTIVPQLIRQASRHVYFEASAVVITLTHRANGHVD